MFLFLVFIFKALIIILILIINIFKYVIKKINRVFFYIIKA